MREFKNTYTANIFYALGAVSLSSNLSLLPYYLHVGDSVIVARRNENPMC